MARNKNSYPKSFWESIYKDYLENELTYKELSEKYNVSRGSISYRFKKDGIPIRANVRGKGYVLTNNYHPQAKHSLYRRPIGPKEKLVGKKYIQSRIIVSPFTGCWEWTGVSKSCGYGQLMIDNKYWTSHRYSYTVYKGEIPEDLVVRHMCHNRRCCNPDHLEVGTQKDNYNDSIEKFKLFQSNSAKSVIINGIRYETIRKAFKETGIPQKTLIKHSNNGVFNIDYYLAACKKANVKPKVTRGDNGKQT